jgi:phospholipase/carboxylesterase
MSLPIDLDGPRFGPAAGGEAKALIVLLHGLGADGNDLISLAPLLGQAFPNAAFASPHAPFPCDMAPMGRQWFSLQNRDPRSMYFGAEGARPMLDRFLDTELAALGLEAKQLCLLGFSQGTMMALHTGLRRPLAIAGVIGFSGLLIGSERLAAEMHSTPPCLLVHGSADEVVPAQMLGAAVEGLREAGVEVDYALRPGLGHSIDEEGLRLAASFLERVLPEA